MACYYFHNITNINDLNFDNILIMKNHLEILDFVMLHTNSFRCKAFTYCFQ